MARWVGDRVPLKDGLEEEAGRQSNMNDSDRPGRNLGPERLTIQREQLRADSYTHLEPG